MRPGMLARPPRRSGLLALAAALTAAPGLLHAQSVVELQAGGTSLYNSYGAAAYAYTNRFTGWVGLGYQNGLLFGAGIQTTFKQDTLRLGSGVLLERYATDLFTPGVNVLTQDIRYTWVRPRTVINAGVGAAAAAPGSQFFPAYSFDDAFASVSARHQLERRVTLGFSGVVSDRQTAIANAAFLAAPGLGLAATAGIGSNVPYGAVAVEYRGRTVTVLGSYVAQGDGFRRVDLPFPMQTEPDRENIQVDWQVRPFLMLGAARQNFLQSAVDTTPAVRATGNSVYGNVTRFGFRAQAGLYASESQGISNLSTYYALGRSFGRAFDAELFVLQSRPSVGPHTTTPIVNLREQVTQRLSLLQQFTFNDDRVTVQLGGAVVTPIGDLGVSWQIVQKPLQPLRPFESVLNLTARIQLGRYSTNVSTVFQQDGSVDYLANASTFLYFGQVGGMQPNLVGTHVPKFVIKGRVVDDQGLPVDGAALDFEGNVAFTNPDGDFQIRVGRPRPWKLTIDLKEFLTPGQWEVVEAPATIPAATEDKAQSVTIILRRVVAPLAPVSSASPRPADAPDPSQEQSLVPR